MSLKKLFGTAMIPASALLLVLGLGGQACEEGSDDPASDGDADGDTDTDTDADTDTDTDADTDTDTDADSDADADEGTIQYGFDADDEGFTVVFTDPEALGDVTTLAFDDANGNPEPGCLAVTTTFDGALQKVMVAINLTDPIDLSGKVITAKVRLPEPLSDSDTDAPHGAKMYVKTVVDCWIWGDGGSVNMVPGEDWTTITLEADNPSYIDAGYDPKEVLEIGIEIASNGTAAGAYNEGTILIDSIAW